MTNKEIFPHIDHTLLRATATAAEIDALCEEAVKYGTASVCIPACYIAHCKKKYPVLNLCTVIGFPLGYSTTAVKCFEAEDAVKNGADEIDMVINLCDVKNGDFAAVEAEMKSK